MSRLEGHGSGVESDPQKSAKRPRTEAASLLASMDPNSQTPSRNRHNQSCTPTPSTDDRFTSRPRLRKAMRGSPRDGHTPSDSMRHLIERPPNPKETLAARLHPKRLQIGIDYGTMTFSAAYRVVSPGMTDQHCGDHGLCPWLRAAHLGKPRLIATAGIDQPIMGEIIDLNFGCEFYAPQAAAWDAQGTFYWGWVSSGTTLLDVCTH